MKQYSDIKVKKIGTIWIYLDDPNSNYKTNIKIKKDEHSAYLKKDEKYTLFLEHVENNIFSLVSMKYEDQLAFSTEEILKYFENAKNKNYMDRFYKKYEDFVAKYGELKAIEDYIQKNLNNGKYMKLNEEKEAREREEKSDKELAKLLGL